MSCYSQQRTYARLKVRHTFKRAILSLAGGRIGGFMSERTQEYRKKMKEKGLIQVRVWVDKQDEKFIKYLSKFCREERLKKEKQRSGRPANSHQIRIAKAIASANNVPEPKHLYAYHISLAAWMWRYKGMCPFK